MAALLGQCLGEFRVLGDHLVKLTMPGEGELQSHPEPVQRGLPAPTSRMVASVPRTLPSL
jgi:hypothetical protein